MNWSRRTFHIWNIHFIVGSLLCCIQLVKIEGQNDTSLNKSFKRSVDFPPIFYPGPDDKFITVAPPPRLPKNLKVFVNNLGSPEITTFRPPFPSFNNGPTSPAHPPPKSGTKPFRIPQKFPSKTSPEDSNSIQTHSIPTTPMPTPRAAEPQHFRPSSSTARPLRKKHFPGHLPPTAFGQNNGHRFSTSPQPFVQQEFRQHFQNKPLEHITESPRERLQRPNPHPIRENSQQRPIPVDRPPLNSFKAMRSKTLDPPQKQFQPLPPQKAFDIPVYMPNYHQGQLSTTSRPFSSSQLGQFDNRKSPPRPNPFLLPPPWMKTSSQSPPPKRFQEGRPAISHPFSQYPVAGNGHREHQFQHKPHSSVLKNGENGFPRHKEQDNTYVKKKMPIKSNGPSFHQQNNDERRPSYQQHRQKYSKNRLNNMYDGRHLQNFSPFNHHHDSHKFSCKFLQPGYYADVTSGCETFHVCHQRRRYTFTCPRGTLFSQHYLICDWSYKTTCSQNHKELF